MPFYDYYCHDCKDRFYVLHGMSETIEACGYCEGPNIERMVANIAYDIRPTNYRTRVGDVVKTHIESAREEIKQQKKDMSKELNK